MTTCVGEMWYIITKAVNKQSQGSWRSRCVCVYMCTSVCIGRCIPMDACIFMSKMWEASLYKKEAMEAKHCFYERWWIRAPTPNQVRIIEKLNSWNIFHLRHYHLFSDMQIIILTLKHFILVLEELPFSLNCFYL